MTPTARPGEMKAAALALAARGLKVFPITPRGKNPLAGSHGHLDASDDPDVIERMWREATFANVGVNCVASGVFGVDVDANPWKGKVGARTWADLVAEHGHVETHTVRSWSGGLHFWYRMPSGLVLRNTVGVSGGRGIGVDVDGRGNGYLIAPPSIVTESYDGIPHTGRYETEHDGPIADLPEWIVEAVRDRESASYDPDGPSGPLAPEEAVVERLRALSVELAGTPDGAGNDAASRFAFMAGQYVGAEQVDAQVATRIMLDGISGWAWRAEGDAFAMRNTIIRGVQDGQKRPRAWERPIARQSPPVAVLDRAETPPQQPPVAPQAAVPVVQVVDTPPAPVDASGPPPEPPVEVGHGQYRMSQRMLVAKGDDLRYSSALGWHAWDGTRWRPDENGAVIRAAHDVIAAAWKAVPDQDSSEERKALVSDIGRVESAPGMNGMLTHLAAMLPVAAGKDPFDKQAELFNTPGGVIDLLNGGLRDHRREDLASKIAGAALGWQRSDVFEDFLARILPDADVRSYVQRLFGQAMLGRVEEHILPIFTGTGANGKGTLRDAVSHAFGDYATDVDPEILMEQKFGRHGTFMMELLGRRLVFCSETERGRAFAEATMKRLVGGDPIQGNRMHKDPVTFMPSHTLILLTNELPIVSGDDPAVWRRLQVVPFDVVIPKDQQDGTLSDRLRLAAPAVLTWVYEGWLAYREQGLNPPEAVRVRTNAYHEENDPLGRFLSERTQPNKNANPKAADVYAAYSAWCREEGEPQETIADFGKSMAKRGIPKVRRATGVLYQGLFVLAGPDEEESRPW